MVLIYRKRCICSIFLRSFRQRTRSFSFDLRSVSYCAKIWSKWLCYYWRQRPRGYRNRRGPKGLCVKSFRKLISKRVVKSYTMLFLPIIKNGVNDRRPVKNLLMLFSKNAKILWIFVWCTLNNLEFNRKPISSTQIQSVKFKSWYLVRICTSGQRSRQCVGIVK